MNTEMQGLCVSCRESFMVSALCSKCRTEKSVDHPQHYNAGRTLDADGTATYEPVKVIEAWNLGLGFCLGNAIKYILRAPHKGSEHEDLMKAKWYLERVGAVPDQDIVALGQSTRDERAAMAKLASEDWGVEGWLRGTLVAIAELNIVEAIFCISQHLVCDDD